MRSAHPDTCSVSMRDECGKSITSAEGNEATFQPRATDPQASHHRCEEHSPPQDDKLNCAGAGKVSWLRVSQNKTLFVRSLFTGPSLRQKSIPHDAFIVFSQTHTRPHICRHGYCTTIAALPKQLKDNCRTRYNYVVDVMECCVMEWIGWMGNSGQDVNAPTQFGDSRSFYFNISPQINTWIYSINTTALRIKIYLVLRASFNL